jgi:DNA end-binding protein Ku
MAATVWRGHITFGLVSIPVRLYRAARSEKVSLRELYRAPPEEPQDTSTSGRLTADSSAAEVPRRGGAVTAEPAVSRIKLKPVSEDAGEPVPRSEVVKGFEYEKDRYVVLEPAELKSIAAETASEMQIQEFVLMAEIDPVYLETSYYVAPESSGEKAYALLFAALKQTGYVGIAQFAMHRREHVVVVRPGPRGVLVHTLYYEQEIRKDQEYKANTDLVTPKELELATMLVQALAGHFDASKYHDTYREKLEALIDARMKGKTAAAAPEKPRKAQVVDIMEALQKSLQATKKPPAGETRAKKTGKKIVRRG